MTKRRAPQAQSKRCSLASARGAVRAADFERADAKAGGWWEWKTEKRALEMLFTSGEVMITRRENFQRGAFLTTNSQARHIPCSALDFLRDALRVLAKTLPIIGSRRITLEYMLGKVADERTDIFVTARLNDQSITRPSAGCMSLLTR